MNRRDVLISFIVLLVILLTIRADPDSSNGCCFLNYKDICYDGSEADCLEDEGEFFGHSCASELKCNVGCCCAASSSPSFDIYPIRLGTCNETFRGQPIEVGQQECELICDQITDETPLCKGDCELNEDDCVGRGRIVDVGFEGGYYCWENNETYKNKVSCDGGCREIGTCVLGAKIEEGCYCGNYFYESGFCCWDNTYTSDVGGGDCPLANECQRYPEGGPYLKCCDACLDEDFTYPIADYDESEDRCPQDAARCCKGCAPDREGCCDYEWQCTGSLLNYNYYSCSIGFPCDEGCIESICVLNERINSGANAYPMCLCAGDYYNTSLDSGYCCLDEVSAFPCEADMFDLKGYVYNINRSNKVPNANVIVKVMVGNIAKRYSTTTDENGAYSIKNIEIGSGRFFNVLIVEKGYVPANFSVEYPTTTEKQEDFSITAVEGVCEAINAPPITNFNANHVKGKKEVELTWENPASIPSEIVGYFIGRDKDFDLGTFYTDFMSFLDDEVGRGETHTYDIAALYSSGGISEKTFASITMGNSDCEGIFGSEEFCLDNRRKQCDENNRLILDIECGPGDICFGPFENGKTRCINQINCREKGNPFGLFCIEGECLGKDPCYYDYSDTIVDEYRNCSGMRDCYDYRSEGACLTDNCLVTGAYLFEGYEPCKWHYMFEEFGKGFCYYEGYDKTDRCYLCNKNSDVFYNVKCDQNVCTKLGACYSDDLSCEPCIGTTTCEDFDNEGACVNTHSLGSRNVTVGDNLEIIGSDDACGLGACKWGDVDGDGNPECFKDANDDDLADCTKGDVGCEDFEPFTTKPQPDIPKMNAEGYGITFYLEGGGSLSDFYFCIDKNNSCYPDNVPEGLMYNTREIVINPVEEADIDEVGNYFIRYYSVDSNGNLEEVKSTEFFVDPIAPELTFSHRFYYEGGHNYAEIILVSDKCVSCDYELNSIPLDKVEEHNFDMDSNEFFIKIRDLEDGNYIFTTTCEDGVGNSVRTDYNFYVDFVHGLQIGYPDNVRLNTEEVRFHLTTADDSDCSLKAIDASESGILYRLLPNEPVVMGGVELVKNKLYNYTALLDLEKDVSYIVKATCVAKVSGEEDYGFFHFTIDKKAPITSSDFDFGEWHRKEGDILTIDFDCNDVEINGILGEAGCKGVYLCTGLNCHENENNYQGLTNKRYQTNVNGLYVSYFSVDNLGNKEDRYAEGHYNQLIRIDEEEPTVRITVPTKEFTNIKEQTVEAIAQDRPSGIDHVEIKVEKVDPLYEVSIDNATKVGNVYKSGVTLYDGLNLITATACDKAFNCVQDTHSIYLDVYAPYIGDIGVLDSDLDLDKGNVFEYRENLSFAVEIEDKYLHPGNNLRYGVGVDPSKVNLKLYDSDGDLVADVGMVVGGGNYYYQNITEILYVGKYSANIEAWDYYGNRNNKLVLFEINDTRPPKLNLTKGVLPISPIKTVYFEDYHITGFTDPLVNVDVYVYGENATEYTLYSGTGADVSEPKPEFNGVKVGINPFTGAFPLKGENALYFEGDYMYVLSKDDYIELSDHSKVPRYKIEGKQLLFAPCPGCVTKVTISPALEKNLDIATASAYAANKPSGWFDVLVELEEGLNQVKIMAKEESGPPAVLSRQINYVSTGMDIDQKTPASGQVLYYTDFYPKKSVTIKVTTNYPAKCNIVNEQESKVAKMFDYGMSSNNGLEHSFVLGSGYCAPSGPFCYINDDRGTGIIYHKYKVECDPTEHDMPSGQKEICFGIATFRDITGPEGQNICGQGANTCSGSFPSSCVRKISDNCAVGHEITSPCKCGDVRYEGGYCCSDGYSTEPCKVVCAYGEITRECDCGGKTYSSGYCCNAQYQDIQCNPQGTRIR